MEEKIPCKVWTKDGQNKKLVAASTFEELLEKAQRKLQFNGTVYLEDGTEIDDQDSFEAACQSSDSPIFVLVPIGEKYNVMIASSTPPQDLTVLSDGSSQSESSTGSGDTIILEDPTSTGQDSASASGSGGAGDIPLPKFSYMFRNSLAQKTQPLPVEKRGAAKAIADLLIEKQLSGRKVFRDMAVRVVALSPESFRNELGNGVNSFARLIENAYINHPSLRLNAKGSLLDKLGTLKGGKRKSPSTKESYGCVQWQPSSVGKGETDESQQQKQQILKEEFSKPVPDHKMVETLMKATYASQRFAINKKPTKPLLEVREEWPFLFLPRYFEDHFYQLTGTSNEKFQANLATKVQTLYNFFCDTKQKRFIRKWEQQIEEAKKTVGNEQCQVVAAVFMLCDYFDEERDQLFREVEETRDLSSYKNHVASPCLVYAGQNPFLTNKLSVTIDQKSVMFPSNILVGMKLLFMSFFVFNCAYPVEVQATLEYMQRMFFSICPERGTKAKKTYRWNVNPKVRSLCEKLMFD